MATIAQIVGTRVVEALDETIVAATATVTTNSTHVAGDGSDHGAVATNTVDIAALKVVISEASWAFKDPLGAGAVTCIGGYYSFGAADWTPSGGDQTFGDAVNSYAAHAAIVLGGSSTDMVVRVSGTSTTDAGVREASATEDIDTSGGSANDYFETTKKWIGTVTFHLQSGASVDCNYGYTKYWDHNNTALTVVGVEVLGVAAKNDASFDVELIHHKSTGWTYNAAAAPDPPVLIGMQADHGAEAGVRAGEPFAWKRANLAAEVAGDASEGLLFRVSTTSGATLDFLTAAIVHFST